VVTLFLTTLYFFGLNFPPPNFSLHQILLTPNSSSFLGSDKLHCNHCCVSSLPAHIPLRCNALYARGYEKTLISFDYNVRHKRSAHHCYDALVKTRYKVGFLRCVNKRESCGIYVKAQIKNVR
jgi:hypothetical protein